MHAVSAPEGSFYVVGIESLADIANRQGIPVEDLAEINGLFPTSPIEAGQVIFVLAPEPGVVTDVGSGVRECVGLMATMLHFCGFRLVNDVEELPAQVLHDALRMVLSAALFALTDAMDEPATVTIHAQASSAEVTLTLQTDPIGDGQLDRYDDGYRKLVWADVQALALAEHVGLSRQDRQVTLRFAVEPAPAH